MSARHGGRAAAGWLVAILVAGCGASSVSPFRREVAVIRAWSDALRRGDVHGAAGYFARPSIFQNGTPPLTVRTAAQAQVVNEELPCGARLVAAAARGRFIDATFVLTARTGPGGTTCGGGVGQTAHTFFLIRGGRIAAWVRAPEGSGPSTAPQPLTTPGLRLSV